LGLVAGRRSAIARVQYPQRAADVGDFRFDGSGSAVALDRQADQPTDAGSLELR